MLTAVSPGNRDGLGARKALPEPQLCPSADGAFVVWLEETNTPASASPEAPGRYEAS